MKRMVIVSPSLDNSGGVERFSYLLADVAKGAGWDVRVVSPRPKYLNGTVARLGLGPLLASRDAAEQAERHRPDLVITNGHLGIGPWPAPRIHVYHDVSAARRRFMGPAVSRRFRVRHTVAHASAEAVSGLNALRVAVSETCAVDVRRNYHLSVHHVVPNGVDTAVFAPGDRDAARHRLSIPPGPPIGLFVGRPEFRKGAELVVPSCREVGWRPYIAGGDLAGAASLGTMKPELLADAYRAADAVIFPTRYEACSYAALEAMTSGVALITTNVGEVPALAEACPPMRQLLVEPSTVSITRRLREAEAGDLVASVERVQAHVSTNYSMQRFAQRWTPLLEQVGNHGRIIGIAP